MQFLILAVFSGTLMASCSSIFRSKEVTTFYLLIDLLLLHTIHLLLFNSQYPHPPTFHASSQPVEYVGLEITVIKSRIRNEQCFSRTGFQCALYSIGQSILYAFIVLW